jgi:hypothetical protein
VQNYSPLNEISIPIIWQENVADVYNMGIEQRKNGLPPWLWRAGVRAERRRSAVASVV